jgi:hypothetical protein
MTRRMLCLVLVTTCSIMISAAGCADKSPPPNKLPPGHEKGGGHEHGEGHAAEGPHHGHLIELGEEEYHAELTHDEATKKVSVYLLDKSAKAAVPITDPEIVLNVATGSQPFQVKLPAAPQPGDPAGQASCFSVVDEKLLEALESPKATGRLNVTINGKAYVGEVAHGQHGDHNH